MQIASIIFFTLITFFSTPEAVKPKEAVTFEIMNKADIPFLFKMDYEGRRQIIKIRSDKAIKSLRLLDRNQAQKSYTVYGSDLIILPKSDFKPGEHIAEFKFVDEPLVIISKIFVHGKDDLSL